MQEWSKRRCAPYQSGGFLFKLEHMKHLIQHLLKNNFEEITSKSFKNCHVMGLHSIMLMESPGKTIRLYYHEPQGSLRLNSIGVVLDTSDEFCMTLGAHAHHCNLTLDCIFGKMVNIVMDIVTPNTPYDVRLQSFKYISPIKYPEVEEMFERTGDGLFNIRDVKTLMPGDSTYMKAEDIHTVFCPGEAAWLVYEGEGNDSYVPITWSNASLEQTNHNQYYQPMDINDITHILDRVGLL